MPLRVFVSSSPLVGDSKATMVVWPHVLAAAGEDATGKALVEAVATFGLLLAAGAALPLPHAANAARPPTAPAHAIPLNTG